MSEDRDYLKEARAILLGETILLTERSHLEALQEYYDVALVKTMTQLQQLIEEVGNV